MSEPKNQATLYYPFMSHPWNVWTKGLVRPPFPPNALQPPVAISSLHVIGLSQPALGLPQAVCGKLPLCFALAFQKKRPPVPMVHT